MNKDKLLLRKATVEDSESIVLLTYELGYQATKSEIINRLSKIKYSAVEEVIVAEYNYKVVGWMHISLVEPLESNPFVEIRGLVVSEAYRRKGIGTKLIISAEEWARDNGIKRLRVRTNIVREETRQYYRKLSFVSKKTQEVFEKEI